MFQLKYVGTDTASVIAKVDVSKFEDFALQHGKMQVKTVVNTTTDEVFSFCVFTNEQGVETKVQFAKDMGTLRPQEIAERKEQLVVVQKLDGSFELNQR